MVAFIQYYCNVFCRAIRSAWAFYGFVSGILALVAGIIVWKHPEWGSTMNNLLWMIPLGGFLFMMAIGFIVTPYKIDEERKEEIKKLQGEMSFFEKNVNTTVKSLENNIKEIDGWFEYINKHQRYACQELRRVICDKISHSFIPTDSSIVDKSIADCFPKILLFLRDSKPKVRNDIKKQYDNITQQMKDIVCICGEDSPLPKEQAKSISNSYLEVSGLKNIMGKLVANLRDCVEIIKEERK